MKIPGGASLRGALFWLTFLVSVAFVPGILEPSTAPRWAVIALGVPFFLLHSKRVAGVGLWGVLTLGCLFVGLVWTPDVLTGVDDALRLLILVGVFLLGACSEDLDQAWKGLAAGVTVSALLAVFQVNGWQGIEQAAAPAGLFTNRNILAETALVALVAMRGNLWWSVGPALAIVLCGTRSVLGALCVLAALQLWPRNRVAGGTLLLAIVGAAAAMFWLGDATGGVRLDLWREQVSELTWLGHGIGSFAALHPAAEHAHFDALEFLYEYGIFVIPMALVLSRIWRPTRDEPEQLVLTAILAVGTLGFPLHMPLTAFCFALAAGRIACARGLVRIWSADPAAPRALRGRGTAAKSFGVRSPA